MNPEDDVPTDEEELIEVAQKIKIGRASCRERV